MKEKPKPPMQPIYLAEDNVIRFRDNAIVRDLVHTNAISLNEIAVRNYPVEDVEQFWQLIGYSVSAYGNLSFIRPKTTVEADLIAAEVLEQEKSRGVGQEHDSPERKRKLLPHCR